MGTSFSGKQIVKIIVHIIFPYSTVAWDKVCRPKYEGGFCIRKIEDTNAIFQLNTAGRY